MICDRVSFSSFPGKEVDQIHSLANHMRETTVTARHKGYWHAQQWIIDVNQMCFYTNNNENIHQLVAEFFQCIHIPHPIYIF